MRRRGCSIVRVLLVMTGVVGEALMAGREGVGVNGLIGGRLRVLGWFEQGD